jgi:hypothetical protein
MMFKPPADGANRVPGLRLLLKGVVFAFCCLADVFVLRIIWARSDIAEGQFRRGYFEEFGSEVGFAMDSAVRPDTLPRFLLTNGGDLGIPPGMTAIMSLEPGECYEIGSHSTRAPYIAIGMEAPVMPASSDLQILPGEARMLGARTLSLLDGRLAFVAWDATRPWRDDAARLAAMWQSCAADGGLLTIRVSEHRLDVGLGRCSLIEPLPSSSPGPLWLAVPAGPDWATAARRPGWATERSILWPVFALVAVKEMAMWFGLGLGSAAAVSATLACAALRVPVEASLTWPLTLLIAVLAAAVRTTAIVLRLFPKRARLPAVLALVALVAWAIPGTSERPVRQSIMRSHRNNGQPDTCAVVGYSTVKGEALRRERGSIRWLLDETCPRCRDKTAALFASGETLAWLRDAYCASPSTFGENGQVIFLGGANDDFLSALSSPSGALAMARAFIQPGLEPWQHGYEAAAAASLTRIGEQVSALEGLLRCVHSRGAQFLFLHDFVVGDMTDGRPPDRAAMLARRRAAAEAAGAKFIDLRERFESEAGISWFNDPVHLSLVGQRRVTELACAEQQ